MKKLEIERLSIEITRRCNMKCSHCMRGNARNTDINPAYITNILKHTQNIGYLNLTGGEPSMNVEAIRFVLNNLKRRKIPVGSFHIVTNGSQTSMSDEFIEISKKLYAYQQEESHPEQLDCMLEMSNDRFHDNTYHDEVYQKLSTYPFFSNRYTNSNREGVPLIKQGRSKIGYQAPVSTIGLDDGNRVYGDVYLNVLGYLIAAGDLSYRNQQKHTICHSENFLNYLKSTQIKNKSK